MIRTASNAISSLASAQRLLLLCLLTAGTVLPTLARADGPECVVLLHGLSRTDFSMKRLQQELLENGYSVANTYYDSRHHSIEELADVAVEAGIAQCEQDLVRKIHFTTHSLGGILVRHYLARKSINKLGRVVMLAPPNRGSEVIDVFGSMPGFELFSGEPALQLGTGSNSVPLQLPPADDFELGVIAGTRSISPLFSLALPDRDDGKVSVESTKVEGMNDFIEVPYTHTFIMQRMEVIDQTLYFLRNGHFIHPDGDDANTSGIPAL
ncbi:esterase/lipase family protein [Pseudohongiella sp.]|uniref:AB hydrolase-1 domain-containing protein n=1 Tax=marine sediment metagenome TaxID=412755 RepID=A0A0F9WIM8_9ZZZZ|nr:alpha/beta fold hydrolase [Pseudohongiella sp.]HDZ07531.1 alpha/beta fold hydrolase [Pseudohongiella sp.]HEA62964.1 alpha/beta fold hydrolase [Pseudohongiella sp.]